jgi:hypothetical protein
MRERRILLLLVPIAIVVSAVLVLSQGTGNESERPQVAVVRALGRGQLEQRAGGGYAHVLYAKSPGGIEVSAARVARYRPLIEGATKGSGIDPDVVEAIVLLESAGRPDARASNDLHGAVGLTQILAQTATGLLGLKVDVAASERLTRAIDRGRKVAPRTAARRRVDERFDPQKALEATVRYLQFAKGHLGGRDDLAVASYHMGVGNLQQALSRFGRGDLPYADLFFGSTPVEHPKAYRKLASLGDDSSTYLWRIRAARDVMTLYRDDPKALAQLAALHAQAQSAEYVLVPPGTEGDGRTPQPALTAALRWIRTTVRTIAGGRGSGLSVAGYDRGGHTVLIRRRYPSPAHAQAFQFALDRLTALGAIAYERDRTIIRVTAGPPALRLPPTPRRS